MTIALALPLLTLSDDEQAVVGALKEKLASHVARNRLKLAYYEGEQRVRLLGISVPPVLRQIEVVAGWAGTAVDVLEERLDWYGWQGADSLGLAQVYRDNALDVESGLAHLDAMIYGTSFVAVGAGQDGEPTPLVTVHSPECTTAIVDRATRRVSAALAVTRDEGLGRFEATLYLPERTLWVSQAGGSWRVEDRDEHALGRVPVVQLENRRRLGVHGRSEITKAVRYYTDAAIRTLLGAEVNREFYSAPQRWAMGASPEDFIDTGDGTVRSGWESIMGRVWAIPRDEEGQLPSVGQFQPASPAPYFDLIRGYSQMLAAEAGIPATYLGFEHDNPTSADAIRAGEARLVKRSERRQDGFTRGWLEVGRLATLVTHDGTLPPEFSEVSARWWRDAATPTRAAAADEATKLVSVGVLPATSSVTYDRLGLSPDEQARLDRERRRTEGRASLSALLERSVTTPAEVDGDATQPPA